MLLPPQFKAHSPWGMDVAEWVHCLITADMTGYNPMKGVDYIHPTDTQGQDNPQVFCPVNENIDHLCWETTLQILTEINIVTDKLASYMKSFILS